MGSGRRSRLGGRGRPGWSQSLRRCATQLTISAAPGRPQRHRCARGLGLGGGSCGLAVADRPGSGWSAAGSALAVGHANAAAMWLPRQLMMAEDSRDEPAHRSGASLRDHCRYARWLNISACAGRVRSPLSPPVSCRDHSTLAAAGRRREASKWAGSGRPSSASFTAAPAMSRRWSASSLTSKRGDRSCREPPRPRPPSIAGRATDSAATCGVIARGPELAGVASRSRRS